MLYITYSPPSPIEPISLEDVMNFFLERREKKSLAYSEHEGHPHFHLILETKVRTDNIRRDLNKLFHNVFKEYPRLLKQENVKNMVICAGYLIKNSLESGGRMVIDELNIERYRISHVERSIPLKIGDLTEMSKQYFDHMRNEDPRFVFTAPMFNSYLNNLVRMNYTIIGCRFHIPILYKHLQAYFGTHDADFLNELKE